MPSPVDHPLLRFLRRQGVIILDGGLATTLEDRGYDLDDDLWSARFLLEDPAAIAAVHRDFLAAGADCVTAATYQASLPGFRRRGLDEWQAAGLLESAVGLALTARDEFWADPANRPGRLRPLVAASVGPYGAFLADGSEYTGRYGIATEDLRRFHRDRWRILAGAGADLLACETLPSGEEADILTALLEETPGAWAWFSFSCRDEAHLWDGTPLARAVARCAASPRTVAVGVNCLDPDLVDPLLEICRGVTDKPLIVYPNAGGRYDPVTRTWAGGEAAGGLADRARGWVDRGAGAVGGCCRTGPKAIARLRRALLD